MKKYEIKIIKYQKNLKYSKIHIKIYLKNLENLELKNGEAILTY